jgi:hypothetical protein
MFLMSAQWVHPLGPSSIITVRFPDPCLVIVPFARFKFTNGSKYEPVANWTRVLVPLLKYYDMVCVADVCANKIDKACAPLTQSPCIL